MVHDNNGAFSGVNFIPRETNATAHHQLEERLGYKIFLIFVSYLLGLCTQSLLNSVENANVCKKNIFANLQHKYN